MVSAVATFHSLVVCSEEDAEAIGKLDGTGPIQFMTVPEPTGRFWANDHGFATMSVDAAREAMPGERPSPHLQIVAADQDTATKALQAVHAGSRIVAPTGDQGLSQLAGVPAAQFSDSDLRAGFSASFRRIDEVAVGCAVALQALKAPSLNYALQKHALSLELDWFTPHSAGASYGRVFPEFYDDPCYHVSAAFAINAAFSVLEELGVEVRSSAKKPRFLDNKAAEWNPVVLGDLDQRLAQIGVRAEDEFRWIARGSETAIHEAMKLSELGGPPEWFVEGTGDRIVTVADAIHLASWLRNLHAAHKFSALTGQIGPYEVHNCQRLARHILLHATDVPGIIKHWRGDS